MNLTPEQNLIDTLPLSSKDKLLYERWKIDHWSISYTGDYLASDHWQIVKKQKLVSVGWRCQLCNEKISYNDYSFYPNNHHRSYYCMWKETYADVFLLCRECHAIHHDKITVKDLQYVRAMGRLVANMIIRKCATENDKKLLMMDLVAAQKFKERISFYEEGFFRTLERIFYPGRIRRLQSLFPQVMILDTKKWWEYEPKR